MFIDFRERKGEIEKNMDVTEKHGLVAFLTHPNQYWNHHLDMCPGLELNLWFFCEHSWSFNQVSYTSYGYSMNSHNTSLSTST